MVRGSGMTTKMKNAGVIGGPGHPCSLLTPAAKAGHHVTTSERVKHQQGHTSVRTNSFGDLMSRDELEALPRSKDNP